MNKMNRLKRHASRLIAVGSLAGALLIDATAAQAQCPDFPIALPLQLLGNVPTNTVIMNIVNGDQLNDFGWLTWDGNTSDGTLIASLTPPGNSTNYVNPDNLADTNLVVGDWVLSRPSIAKKNVRSALDNLVSVDIIVPVFDAVRGSGSTLAYHVAAFAQVQLVGYRVSPHNTISVFFVGFVDCSGGPGV
jgi:hypothetical protein